jgi:hypothetical protein
MALVILSWLKSATVPSRFLILPTVLTIPYLLPLLRRSQTWEFRRQRANIDPSRNHGDIKGLSAIIPYLVAPLRGKYQILYFPKRLYTSAWRLVKAFSAISLSC